MYSLPDAETLLGGVLNRDSTDGQANLQMAARSLEQEEWDDAKSYHHMAIYGHWSEDAAANRIEARSELIEILVKQDAKKELTWQDESAWGSFPNSRLAQPRGRYFPSDPAREP